MAIIKQQPGSRQAAAQQLPNSHPRASRPHQRAFEDHSSIQHPSIVQAAPGQHSRCVQKSAKQHPNS
eukprot:11192916-Lingulodinium_polyedra.AAC.1